MAVSGIIKVFVFIGLLGFQLSCYAQQKFEGVLDYEIVSKTQFGTTRGSARFFVSDDRIREEIECVGLDVVIVQIDFLTKKKTTAIKGKWVVSEVNFDDFDDSSAIAVYFSKKDLDIIQTAERLDFRSSDSEIVANVEFMGNGYASRFLEFFEVIRLAKKQCELGQLLIPKRFYYEIGDTEGELLLVGFESKKLVDEVFSLPEKPVDSEGSDIFENKKKR